MNVLVVEDEQKLADGMARFLTYAGFTVSVARTLAEAKRLLDQPFDAVLLDVRLPDGEGWTLIPRLQTLQPRPAIVLTTARGEADDRVFGLELGADDYLVKPIVLKELEIRLKRLVKQTDGIVFGDLKVDEKSRTVTEDGKPIRLANKEYELLLYFMKHIGEALDRNRLLDDVWDYTFVGDTRTVDTHVKQLRDKSKTIKRQLKTVHRVGYRLEDV
ncbi:MULTISPECIES: response regulator transcription factor [Exiguobacterium]|uniref:response regulator transcription factor n=1 Tax=Exiguobacterium TaxID=33986 RepID=UPI0008775CBE|nr:MULTISPECIES: response regulator transcription factor [Exiguobacterium]TCI34469.1 response regulator transcription factor [Exiguobacterium sp. SH4S7]TCI44222.1 response regulator transcription factor [Exiguobacterium sp. SH5S32]TCI50488.1 response regulator transcription factor [Exiguobacterium sp. SH1S4]TCI69446.1 response regulator transcription factor [Exiguobacterium sp. SH1S1]TCI77006.1 response regulator transcription factor [Exiguobacterium sp. SH0S1]